MTTMDDAPLTRREFQVFREDLRQDTQSFREDMRQDIQSFREDMRQSFQAFREEFHRELQHYATKADVAELRADVAETKSELIKWMVGLMVASTAAASAIALTVLRLTEG